ncbi:hypothetical protein MKW94_029559, partial [Papaver nudicaule]|nr:hypothetical protein [Papaver nudicaule]
NMLTSTSPFGQPSTSPFAPKPFGTTNQFGTQTGCFATPAFGAPTASASVAATTPAFGSQPTLAFGVATTPAFGSQPTPAFGTATTPAFGSQPTLGCKYAGIWPNEFWI